MIVKNKTGFIQFIDGKQVYPFREEIVADDVTYDTDIWERLDAPKDDIIEPQKQQKKQRSDN